MKIFFERSGGFAGIKLDFNLDLDEISSEEAADWQKLLDAADIFQLPEYFPESNMPDAFQYTLTVESASEKRTLEIGETSIPGTLRPLLNELTLKARSKR